MATLNASCMVTNLRPALIAANRGVRRSRSSLAVLQGILVESEDGSELRLTGTDLSMRITTRTPAKIVTDGAVVIPAAAFLAFVKRAPKDAKLDIIASPEGQVTLSTVAGSITLRGIEASDFPVLAMAKKPTAVIRISSGDLTRAMRGTAFSAGDNGNHPVLTGVFVAARGNTLTVVGCDNYRISEYVVPTLYGGTSKGEVTAIIPVESVEAWLALGVTGDDPTLLTIYPNNLARLSLELSDYRQPEMWTMTIDGTYPSYTQVIPINYAATAEVSRSALVEAIKGIRHTVCRLSFRPDSLTIEATDLDDSTVRNVIPATYDGPEITMGFDPHMLVGLANAPADHLTLKLPDAGGTVTVLAPLTVKADGVPSWTHIIMPVRLSEFTR